MFKVLSQQVRITLTKAFEKHLAIEELPTRINIRASSFAVKHHEMETDKAASKIISYTKIQTCILKDIISK